MFDISWTEILVIMVVALVAIGPKDLPRVLYGLGKWVRRLRGMAAEFQRHFSDMMHETELDELRRQAQEARDLAGPGRLADLVDPGGTLRHGFDPTGAGAMGHAGSPGEAIAPTEPPPPPGPPAESPKPSGSGSGQG